MSHPVFVYGTLRQGGFYHHLIENLIKSSKKAYTKGNMYHYPLNGDYGYYPYLTEGDQIIYGELFTFNDFNHAMSILDDLEDNGNLYKRKLHPVYDVDNQNRIAWVYFIIPSSEKKGKWIESGDWLLEINNLANLSF